MAFAVLGYPTGIHSLPVELLTRIFVLGAGYDYPYTDSPFLLKPEQNYYAIPSSSFPLLVSHVCKQWRQIARHTACLWTLLHFREPPHLLRAEAYISRAPSHVLDILIETVAFEDHIPGVTLCRDEIQSVFNIIVPHVKRWRAFHLKIQDHECKMVARQRLSTCGPAPNLETLQLYHFEDYRTPQNLYLATHRPTVMIFDNVLPRLKNISLIGVSLRWSHNPDLLGLRCLELALHPDVARPPYRYWETILRGSPELQTLSLHYSGPRATSDDPDLAWSDASNRILLSNLEELSLTDLDPDYLCLVMKRLVLPAVKRLALDLPDQDFTPFVDLIIIGSEANELLVPRGAQTSVIDPTPSTASSITVPFEGPDSPVSGSLIRPAPLITLVRLQTLKITALECSVSSWRALLHSLVHVTTLEIDFARVGESFYAVFLEGVDEQISSDESVGDSPAAVLPPSEITYGEGRRAIKPFTVSTSQPSTSLRPPMSVSGVKRIPLLPQLRMFTLSGLSGEKVKLIIEHREGDCGCGCLAGKYGLDRWVVRWSERRKGRDFVLDELVEQGWNVSGRKIMVEWFEGPEEEEEQTQAEDSGDVSEEPLIDEE